MKLTDVTHKTNRKRANEAKSAPERISLGTDYNTCIHYFKKYILWHKPAKCNLKSPTTSVWVLGEAFVWELQRSDSLFYFCVVIDSSDWSVFWARRCVFGFMLCWWWGGGGLCFQALHHCSSPDGRTAQTAATAESPPLRELLQLHRRFQQDVTCTEETWYSET